MKHNYKAENTYIKLKPMDNKTSEEYRKLRNNEDVKKYFFTSSIITEDEQKKWFTKYLEDDSQAMFAIFDNQNRFIGGIGFYDLSETDNWVEIGRIIINPEIAKGKGYGKMAIELLVDIIFRNYSIDIIGAYIYSDNIPSIKSFTNAGFKKDLGHEGEKTVKMLYKREEKWMS